MGPLGALSRYPPTVLRSNGGMVMGETDLCSGGRREGGEYMQGDWTSARGSLTMGLP